jgi:hypothetical protein
MAIVFPASPSTNDTFTAGSITYKWDGAKWIGLGVTPADRLVEGSNKLEITAGNDLVWTGDSVLLGTSTSNSSDRLTILDPGSAFMSIRSDVASDGNSQVLDFGVGTADRSSANLTAIIEADTHSQSGGTLKSDLVFSTNSGDSISERLRITSAGQLIIHHNTNVAPDGYESKLQLADDSYQGSSTVWKRAAGSSAGANPALILQKVRGADINGQGAVADSDSIGQIRFYGADGTTAIECGNISATVDNTTSTNNVPGKLVFKTAKLQAGSGSPVNPTQAMTIKANHNVEIHDGNLVFETAGTGIDFSANANATGMSSELLDDYEEGTWSPQIKGWNGSYSASEGGYIKIGRQVFISGEVRTNASTGTGTDTWPGLSNLPFVNTTAFHPIAGSQRYMGNATLLGNISPSNSGMAFVTFDRYDGTSFFPNHITPTGANNFQNTMINNITTDNFGYRFNCTYFTD